MLFSCLKSKYITFLSIVVFCLSNDTSRKISHHLLCCSHKSKIWSAECNRKSKWLSFANCHISSIFCRCLYYTERNRIDIHHIFRTSSMCDLTNLGCFFQITVIVRMLDQYTCCLCIYMFFQIFHICKSVFFRNYFYFHFITEAVCFDCFKNIWIHGS